MIVDFVLEKIRITPKFAELYTKDHGVELPKRKFYFSLEKKCKEFLNGDISKKTVILPGLRGTGKTTALLQLYRSLTEVLRIPREYVLYLSCDEIVDLLGSNLHEVLSTYFNEVLRLSPETLQRDVFLLVDEAHFDRKWQATIKVLHDRSQKVFVVVTGSSSIAMELTPDLVRRVIKEVVYPLNFSEYLVLKYKFHPPTDSTKLIKNAVFAGRFSDLKDLHSRLTLEFAKKVPSPLETEFTRFMMQGGFAFGVGMEADEVFLRTREIVEKIVRADLPTVYNMKTENISIVLRLLTYLAMQHPGGVSASKLASALSISPNTVNMIIDMLERTLLVFRVPPADGAGVRLRGPYKCYFATPTVLTALNWHASTVETEKIMGNLLETLVASYLVRAIESSKLPYNIYYDADKRGVDFVLRHTVTNEGIPIEVTSSLKGSDVKKTIKAISKYDSKFGIIIVLKGKPEFRDEVYIMPASLFAFL